MFGPSLAIYTERPLSPVPLPARHALVLVSILAPLPTSIFSVQLVWHSVSGYPGDMLPHICMNFNR